MTTTVAICKAVSMIENIRVSVSFRSTIANKSNNYGSGYTAYVVLAYDSLKDNFNKIRTLFPYLYPNGCTPEGLTFEAILNEFKVVD